MLSGVARRAAMALRRIRETPARVGRQVRRRVTGNNGAFVLMYHRVDVVGRDPWGLAVSPEHFAQQLDVLRREARPMPLEEFAAAHRAGSLAPNAIAITFDDGYADNLQQAAPILRDVGVPATVFLATGYAGHGLTFWWDQLEHFLLGPHALPERLSRQEGASPLHRVLPADVRARRDPDADRRWRAFRGSPDPRQALYQELWRLFTGMEPAARADALRQMAETVVVASDSLPRAMTAPEVAELVADGLIQTGAHSVSHPALPLLSPERQREEIVGSRGDVAALTGRPVTSFSYPHGRFDDETVRIVRDAGFVLATTVAEERSQLDCARVRSDGLHVPRVAVQDWDADTFRRRLRSGFEP